MTADAMRVLSAKIGPAARAESLLRSLTPGREAELSADVKVIMINQQISVNKRTPRVARLDGVGYIADNKARPLYP